ncbi:putative AP2 protein [Hordeum vulgare]|nr:putative AP2 protein [Hordeum vulgare]
MTPRRRGSSGYRGVRERPSGTYYAEIQSGDVRLGLDMFETSHEATRAYDTAAWRLGRPRVQMNFQDVYTREQAQDLTPLPRLITDQDREEHHRQQRRLLVTEEDENAFWAERTARRRAERDDRRRRKALAIMQCKVVNNSATSIFTSDNERLEDAWLDTSDSSENDDSE